MKTIALLLTAVLLSSCATNRDQWSYVVRDLYFVPTETAKGALVRNIPSTNLTIPGLQVSYKVDKKLAVVLIHGMMTSNDTFGVELARDLVSRITGVSLGITRTTTNVGGQSEVLYSFDKQSTDKYHIVESRIPQNGEGSAGWLVVHDFRDFDIKIISVYWKPITTIPQKKIRFDPTQSLPELLRKQESVYFNPAVKDAFIYDGFADAILSQNPNVKRKLNRLLLTAFQYLASEKYDGLTSVITHSAGSLIFDNFIRSIYNDAGEMNPIELPVVGDKSIGIENQLVQISSVFYLANQISLLNLATDNEIYSEELVPNSSIVTTSDKSGVVTLQAARQRFLSRVVEDKEFQKHLTEVVKPDTILGLKYTRLRNDILVVAFSDPSDALSVPVVNKQGASPVVINFFLPMTNKSVLYSSLNLFNFKKPWGVQNYLLVNPIDAHVNFIRDPVGSEDEKNDLLVTLLKEGKIERSTVPTDIICLGLRIVQKQEVGTNYGVRLE